MLIENVTHHIDEEEKGLVPEGPLRSEPQQLGEIGEELLRLKDKAPTSPAQPSALKKTIDAVIS